MVPIYRAPVDEVMFLLTDVLAVPRYDNLPGFADAAPDLTVAILRDAARFCEQAVQPLNRSGDQEGCTRQDDGSVTTPSGFKAAYRQYVDGGWMGISAPAEYGGQGLPGTLSVVIHEFMNAANLAFAMYPGLTQGALSTILAHGTSEQKARYLPAMIAGGAGPAP
jgi:acyl-CoA dehydrogenase